MKIRAQVVACAVILGRASVATAAPESDPRDEKEVQAMRAQFPHAAELLAQGETLAASGQQEPADALFVQALKESPETALLWRRHCEARTVLGTRDLAVYACTRALERSRTGLNFRALVGAFIDSPVAPTTTELYEALIVTAAASKEAVGQPTAPAAACDIAEKTGDGVMLQRCAEDLVRIAPDDPATRKALARLALRCPPSRFWIGWLAIALAVVVTLGDAARRFARRWPKRRARVAAVALIGAALGGFAGARTALADETPPPAEATPQHGWLSKWHIDADHPEANLPSEKDRNADPLQFGYWLQDLVWKAENASKKGDHAQAAKYYVALADAVPDRSAGFTLACQEYEALGELDHAISACGQGLMRDGVVVKDYTHFVHLILAKPGHLAKKDGDAIATILAHMREDPAGRDYVDELECEVAARMSNVAQLRECTAGMAAHGAEGAKLLAFEWNLAVEEHKFGLARDLVERAKAAGTPPEQIDSMLKVTSSYERGHWLRMGLFILAFALVCSGVGIGLRALRRRSAGSAGGAHPPPPPSVEKSAVPG